MTINKLSTEALETARRRGFYNPANPESFASLLAGIHSELSEAYKADRNDQHCVPGWLDEWKALGCGALEYEAVIKDTVEAEIADAFIRVASLAAHIGMNLEAHVAAALLYNEVRHD